MQNKPKISFVVTTRNDNHGGDLLKRTTCFIEGIYHQAKKFNLKIELIIVEWNPPNNKPFLKDVLPKPNNHSLVILRYIIVPERIHEKYKLSHSIPLYQMIAKNVGIVRANADFVLCTNIDLLFSDELFEHLSLNNFKPNIYYRANRVDIPTKVMEFEGFEKQLNFGKKNIISRLGKGRGNEYIFGVPDFLYWFGNTMKLLNVVFKLFFHIFYSKNEVKMLSIDTFACGDFTLMHKDDWKRIEGYPELDLYSIHVDSMAIIAATAIGIKQEILPHKMCSYHIYHENGWESFKDNPVDLIRFIEKKPGLDWFSIYESGKHLVKNKKTWGLNKPDWGFSNEKFKEYIFVAGKEMQEIN